MVVKTIKNLASNVAQDVNSIVKNQKTYYASLCTPAKIEYAISVVGIASLAISCLTNGSGSKLDDTCMDVLPYLIVSAIFVFILNALCKGGASLISWIMIICPLCALFISVFNKSPELPTEGFESPSKALKEFRAAMDEASEKFNSDRDDDEDEDYDDEDDEDDDEDYDDDELFTLADMESYEDQEPYADRDQADMPQLPKKKNEYKAEKKSNIQGAPQENFGVLDDIADVLEQKKNEAYNAIQKIKDTITGEKKEDFGVLDDIADVIEQKKAEAQEAYGKVQKTIGKLLSGDQEQFGDIKPASYYRY